MEGRPAIARTAGFTLTELAVVTAIVALLLGSLMYTLAAQTEQRNFEETRRRLEQAKELLLGFAIVQGRLPCPARYSSPASHSGGLESFCAAAPPASCPGTETTTVQAHGNCSNYHDGYLPAAAIGWTQVDPDGFAVDAWGNRIRYAVARLNTNCSTPPPPHAAALASRSAPGASAGGLRSAPRARSARRIAAGCPRAPCRLC